MAASSSPEIHALPADGAHFVRRVADHEEPAAAERGSDRPAHLERRRDADLRRRGILAPLAERGPEPFGTAGLRRVRGKGIPRDEAPPSVRQRKRLEHSGGIDVDHGEIAVAAGVLDIRHQIAVGVRLHPHGAWSVHERARSPAGRDDDDRRLEHRRRGRRATPGCRAPRRHRPHVAPRRAGGASAPSAASVEACGSAATKGKRRCRRSNRTTPSVRPSARASPRVTRTAEARSRSVIPDGSSAARTGECTPIARVPSRATCAVRAGRHRPRAG